METIETKVIKGMIHVLIVVVLITLADLVRIINCEVVALEHIMVILIHVMVLHLHMVIPIHLNQFLLMSVVKFFMIRGTQQFLIYNGILLLTMQLWLMLLLAYMFPMVHLPTHHLISLELMLLNHIGSLILEPQIT